MRSKGLKTHEYYIKNISHRLFGVVGHIYNEEDTKGSAQYRRFYLLDRDVRAAAFNEHFSTGGGVGG